MNWLTKIASKLGFASQTAFELTAAKQQIEQLTQQHTAAKAIVKALRTSKRSYNGADVSRLTADWLAGSTDANAEVRTSTVTLRNRTRALERNDDYMRRYFSLLENNVLGAFGIGLQLKIRKPNGQPDKPANDAIEMAWAKWGKKRNCTVNRAHTWRALCRLVLRSAKRDGGVFIRKVRGFDNEFRYALQLLEIDHLDLNFNASLPGGNRIEGGVEVNVWGEAVAYHIFRRHPGNQQPNVLSAQRDRVPADEMLHIFLPDRISQLIGAPAPSATILRLKMLAGYEDAELTAAREGACKGYAITQASPDGYVGEDDGTGRQLEDVEPGMKLLLNPGEELHEIDPKHPTEAFPNFVKSILRAVAGGLGVSYNSLANDLEGVNYSSIRAGLLEEREEWKAVQQWFCEEICEPIFEDWLQWSLGFGLIKSGGGVLGLSNYDYYNQPEWKPRRWAWVDPEKDVEANRKAIALRLKSRRCIISEEGEDMDEVDADFNADPVTSNLNHAIAYVPDAAKVEVAEVAAKAAAAAPAAAPMPTPVDGRLSLNGKGH
jgi:lambda family phage portal protein